jgi:SAM-dependent methyltransferase
VEPADESEGGVRDDGAFSLVVDGYDAVYSGVAASPTFRQLWAEHAYGGPFPPDYAHISFLTLDELEAMAAYLGLGRDTVLADLACGAGGPGLWVAARSGCSVVGIDPSQAGLAAARQRADVAGLADRARYQAGTFSDTNLDDRSMAGVISIDAIQYAPDKRAVFSEVRRILGPGGRVAFSAFEVDPERVQGLPVLGVDPVDDYAALLEDAGFAIAWTRESDGWADRVSATFTAVTEAMPTLIDEMGDAAASSLGMEAALTLQFRPYRRRVVVAATAT